MSHSYQSQNPKSHERGCLVLLRLLCWLSVLESLRLKAVAGVQLLRHWKLPGKH